MASPSGAGGGGIPVDQLPMDAAAQQQILDAAAQQQLLDAAAPAIPQDPPVQQQIPQDPAAPVNPPDPRDQVISQLTASIAALEQRVNQLGQQASSAVTGLGQQVHQAQQGAQIAAGLATQNPRGIRIPQPQRFKGNRDGPKVLEWAHQATTYLKAAGMDASEAGVWHISNFFEGDAAVWWRLQCDKYKTAPAEMPQTWEQLEKLLVAQFQIFNHVTDIRDQYSALRQTASVTAYIAKFRSLVVELPSEPEDQQIYQFLKGLKPEIQARTRTHKPKTLADAMDIADEADRANYHAYHGRDSRTASYGRSAPSYGRSAPQGPTPMVLGAATAAAPARAAAILAPQELQRLRQQNRCFECRKEGHLAKDCPKRKQRKGAQRTGRRRQPEN